MTVYQRGLRLNASALGLRALKRTSPPTEIQPSRIGFSISQKVSKHAVARNLIKRRLRAAIRELLPRLSQGWDIVVVAHSTAPQCSYQQFLQQLKQLLAQANIAHGD